MERIVRGDVPAKHHIAFRDADGSLRWEECLTRDGFDGAFTLLYHQHRPHEQRHDWDISHGWSPPEAEEPGALAKRHFKTQTWDLGMGGPPIDAVTPLLFNRDVMIAMVHPDASDPVYRVSADGDDLYFIQSGSGLLRTALGDLRFTQHDYVYVPKGIIHRFIPDEGVEQKWLYIECRGGMGLLKQWRNGVGQLKMGAPYCSRDFTPPTFVGPLDEDIRHTMVKRGGRFHGFVTEHSPLDVVGWDGSTWPFVFPITNFQPRAGLVHLPPTWHGTFACRGGLICSFVPRTVDFHPEAIPCPYPHSSIDVDEFLFYVEGNFTSRKGVGPGSISLHPAGIPHGPHPGAYEGSIGHAKTNELAVMLDVVDPLLPTHACTSLEDHGYHDSFIAG